MTDRRTNGDAVSVSRDIEAPPDQVWAMVSDLPRMGEWSPENTGGRWLGRTKGPRVGARFRGTNRSGWRFWSTVCTVTTCDPGTSFAFDVKAVGFNVARWAYEIEPLDNGCRITETWTDQRSRVPRLLGKPVSGVGDRPEHNRIGMEETLERLAASAEQSANDGRGR